MNENRGTVRSYVIGFVLSIVCTLLAYYLVVQPALPLGQLLVAVVGLALAQFVVQLLFFLHLGREDGSRWKLLVFLFMTGVVVIVVGGSLWIMQSLNYRTLSSPPEVTRYLHDQGGF